MTLDDAYNILGIPIGSSRDEILEAYKRLVKKHHPDKGGTDEKMQELNSARDEALIFIDNNKIYSLAIAQVKDLLLSDRQKQEKKQERKDEVNQIYLRLDSKKSRHQKIKEYTLYFGILAGFLTLLVSNVLPIYKQEVGEDQSKLITIIVLSYAFGIGIIYLFLSTLESRIKDKIEELKEILEGRQRIINLLTEIFGENIPTNTFTETEFEKHVDKWVYDNTSEIDKKSNAEPFYIDQHPIIKIVRKVGKYEFRRLLLLKAQDKEIISELSIKRTGKNVTYKLEIDLEDKKDENASH